MSRSILVVGTDTGVGKTVITAGLVRALNQKGIKTLGVKPFACGAVKKNGRWIYEEIELLNQANGKALIPKFCIWRSPLAPYRASLIEKKPLDLKKVRNNLASLKKKTDLLLIEGVGGLLCPLTGKMTLADWAKKEKLPLLLVARLGLGTLNHTLITIEAAKRRGLKIKGIILNDHPRTKSDLSRKWNPEDIRRLTKIPMLGILPHFNKPSLSNTAKVLKNFKLDVF